MASYNPTKISKFATGLIQEKENFNIPNDAFPILQNAYCWRERIKIKQGNKFLGRLRRAFIGSELGMSTAVTWSFNIFTVLGITETNAEIEVGSVVITIGAIIFTDDGDGVLASATVGNSGTINYVTGDVVLTHTAGVAAGLITYAYFPSLPVMGISLREQTNVNNEGTVAFDTVYAYKWDGEQWEEFITGTTWTGSNSDFFWTTNWYTGDNNQKIFWATNDFFDTVTGLDPIRYTNGTNWADFIPPIDGTKFLQQALILVPFRNRLLAFNTYEGDAANTTLQYQNRIRWSQIGTPFYRNDINIVTTGFDVDSWRDDIIGRGGFIDIPTSQAIVSVGFVRDNLVIYCERSTWQLRYTANNIQPFIIEKINTELGTESTFSGINFDTSLVGIGDKGIVECDSFRADRIDMKIPDLIYTIKNTDEGIKRVHGLRDFERRLAYWNYPTNYEGEEGVIFPNKRLIFNYEDKSWAIFDDFITAFGRVYFVESITWEEADRTWEQANVTWAEYGSLTPTLIAGNQQGFTFILDAQTNNDKTLSITAITQNNTTATQVECINHNFQSGQVIKIRNIPVSSTFAATLNDNIFGIQRIDEDNFYLFKYSDVTKIFDDPQIDDEDTPIYFGGGTIDVRDRFQITSKKFNYMEMGENILLGHIDTLIETTSAGDIVINVYKDYNDSDPINTIPENQQSLTLQPDPFFNSVMPTTNYSNFPTSKIYERFYCKVRGNFVSIEYTLSNEQMSNSDQAENFQIDSITLWTRPAGRNLIGA